MRIHPGEESSHLADFAQRDEFYTIAVGNNLQAMAGSYAKGFAHQFGYDDLEFRGHFHLFHAVLSIRKTFYDCITGH